MKSDIITEHKSAGMSARGFDAGPAYKIIWKIRGTKTKAHGIRCHDDLPEAVESALRQGATDIVIKREQAQRNDVS